GVLPGLLLGSQSQRVPGGGGGDDTLGLGLQHGRRVCGLGRCGRVAPLHLKGGQVGGLPLLHEPEHESGDLLQGVAKHLLLNRLHPRS
ncbi:hypothetical protein HMPREF0058_0038, partial [Actinomyces urogenitalis DSM 15434]